MLHYFSVNETNATVYNITITKAVPALRVSIGGYVVNSSANTINLLGSSYVKKGNKLYMLPVYALNGRVDSHVLYNNQLPYTYNLYIGGKLVSSTNVTLGQLDIPFNQQGIPTGTTAKIVFETAGLWYLQTN